MSELFIADYDEVGTSFERRCANTLGRQGAPEAQIPDVVADLRAKVGFAVAGLPRKVPAGRGRPLDFAFNLLAVEVPDVLKQHGLSDAIWREPNDDEGLGGRLSLAAELEAIAQTALSEARGKPRSVEARPARISKARKLLNIKRPQKPQQEA